MYPSETQAPYQISDVVPGATLAYPGSVPYPHHDLICHITWEATRLAGALTKIRLIKFLYLADVYLFGLVGQRATPYRWRFYHYGPWALEAQRDIEDLAQSGAIEATTRPRDDEIGEMTLYSTSSLAPNIEQSFGLRFETRLNDAIRTWAQKPLNEFLDYVYFDTPPMRDAHRGDYLHFDPEIFTEQSEPAPRPLPRHSSREALKAWRAFLKSAAGGDRSSVSIPQDAIADSVFKNAVDRLDAEDALPRPIDAGVDVRPDELR